MVIFSPGCIASVVMVPTHTCQMASCQGPMALNCCMKKTHWDGHLEKADKKKQIIQEVNELLNLLQVWQKKCNLQNAFKKLRIYRLKKKKSY